MNNIDINHNRSEIIRSIFLRYYSEEANYKETGNYSSLSNLDYGEEEVTFHDLIAQLKNDKIILPDDDKLLIDKIGESLWNGGQGAYRMRTKYWKDIV